MTGTNTWHLPTTPPSCTASTAPARHRPAPSCAQAATLSCVVLIIKAMRREKGIATAARSEGFPLSASFQYVETATHPNFFLRVNTSKAGKTLLNLGFLPYSPNGLIRFFFFSSPPNALFAQRERSVLMKRESRRCLPASLGLEREEHSGQQVKKPQRNEEALCN